ncbi:arabinogalactan endo-1,4-beta-galactosidase [Artomyces pyxidatus]|uniref:Arabinogalactan endo-1,4-beta-galactosidase n=1 Tax=Artomyces pyxidatus TaxID=48021 RepID=A0ACB8SRY0_9AGAM|nr:arabinogalactan endo-1,4-beta-galactosidase [Artomyces pyxidatus]
MRLFTLRTFFAASVIGSRSALALQYHGADISSVAVVEGNGITYKDINGATGKLENILKNHGMNTARVRLWTSGTYSTSYGLALAKRIKAAGLTLIVDLHFSDTWADPGHQSIPSGWGTTVSQLNTAMYDYLNTVQAFNNQGTPIDILQLGNEINNGLLWPVGHSSTSGGWSASSQFLHSARQGSRDAGFNGKVMIHLADGWSSSEQSTFWNNILIPGAFSTSDFDIQGVSFYPFYGTSATTSNLQSSLTALVNKFGKEVMVAETDWPAVSCSTALSASYPDTPAGQAQWQAAITSVLSSLPNGKGVGTLYWEPAWIGNANLGSSCSDNLLVDSSGEARSSIK